MTSRFVIHSVRKRLGVPLRTLAPLVRRSISMLSRLETGSIVMTPSTYGRIYAVLLDIERVKARSRIPIDLSDARWLKRELRKMKDEGPA